MKIPWIFGGFLFLVIQLSVAKLDENILGAQGSELLKELKESGVLDSFEQELEKMLHQEKIKNEEGDDTNEIKVNIQFHEFFDSFNFFAILTSFFFRYRLTKNRRKRKKIMRLWSNLFNLTSKKKVFPWTKEF